MRPPRRVPPRVRRAGAAGRRGERWTGGAWGVGGAQEERAYMPLSFTVAIRNSNQYSYRLRIGCLCGLAQLGHIP